MKHVKKILALVLAMVMVLSMATVASAAEGDVSLSITNPVEGHTYSYYQLMVGDVSADGKTLSNVKWGSDVATSIAYKAKASKDATEYTEAVTISPEANADVPQAVLDYLMSLAGSSNELEIANTISSWVTGAGTAIQENTEVATGYYVIKDAYTDTSATQTTTLSTNLVKIVGSTEIEPKAGTTEHKKEVLDVNDSTETALDLDNLENIASGWDKTADHDFGDKVPFKLTTTIGSDFAKYTSYYLSVNDNMCNGLTLDQNSIKVFVGGTEVAEEKYDLTTDDHSFSVVFNKLNDVAGAAANAEVVVYYTATLNANGIDVVIGNDGNPNTSYAEFSNNPNGDQSGTGRTPDSTAVVFTYKADVDKINKDGDALFNAGFTLYKKYYAAVEGKANVAGTTPAGAQANTFPAGEFWYEVESIAATETNSSFEFKGIDDGTYILVESETPNGYNTMAPITLTVTAIHGASETSQTGYSVSALSAGNDNFRAAANGGAITFDRIKADDKTLDSGEIYSEIVNYSGTELPETGGIGTTIFYVVGSILLVGAAILLITKRRMSVQR